MTATQLATRGGRRQALRRRLIYAAATVALAVVAATGAIVAADILLHRKYERTGAVNIWGYRGPAVGPKRPGEVRIVVLGGSTAFGYGGPWDEAFPYQLEQILNGGAHDGQVRVVNLAFNNETAHAFRPTLEDYAYLDYDLAILYEGYNDLVDHPRTTSFRRESAIFRLTGYLPILPLVLREKAFALAYGGDVARGYAHPGTAPTVFRPGLADQVAAGALDAAAETARSLERQLGRLTRERGEGPPDGALTGCEARWRAYCGAVLDAVQYARRAGVRVLVAGQPSISDAHVDQQRALAAMIRQHFGDDPGVAYVDMGGAIDLGDRTLAYDGMHLTPRGNRRLAEAFADPVRALLAGGDGR